MRVSLNAVICSTVALCSQVQHGSGAQHGVKRTMLARSRENKIAADSLVDTLNSASREIAEVISGKKDLRQSLRRELEDGKRQPLSGKTRPLLASKRLGALAETSFLDLETEKVKDRRSAAEAAVYSEAPFVQRAVPFLKKGTKSK